LLTRISCFPNVCIIPGKIGDWKNHLTVAENEMFDEYLAKWPLSKEIKFTFI